LRGTYAKNCRNLRRICVLQKKLYKTNSYKRIINNNRWKIKAMGTRNLTRVICDGKTKVAQYGQWDGYPEGQGKTVLNFLRGYRKWKL
jgi:hypothetical protein